MPGFDRSGPMGGGAMTGGQRGFCNTTNRAGAGAAAGYGFGRGCRRGGFYGGGAGRGFGRGFDAEARTVSSPLGTAAPADELEYLTRQAQNLESSLQTIKKRIDDLQQKSE